VDQVFEIFAIRYGHLDRRSPANFIGGDEHDQDMPLAYYVWLIRRPGKTWLLDTGFDAPMGLKRGRNIVRPVETGLRELGVDPASIDDIIISHMHFDHAGNRDLFPNARYHVQDREMAYCTGRCMCHGYLNHSFDVDDVTGMVRKLYDGRLRFHDGDSEIEPGLTVHRLGGHTQGLQVVRVKTARGWVVLASDAAHFYANFQQGRPFPAVESATDMLAGFDRMRELATSDSHIIPGHDPLVLEQYPLAMPTIAGTVRLDIGR